MNTTPYTTEDYKGEFNILKSEKELMIRVGNMVKGNRVKMAYILGSSEKTVITKIKKHKIEIKNKLA